MQEPNHDHPDLKNDYSFRRSKCSWFWYHFCSISKWYWFPYYFDHFFFYVLVLYYRCFLEPVKIFFESKNWQFLEIKDFCNFRSFTTILTNNKNSGCMFRGLLGKFINPHVIANTRQSVFIIDFERVTRMEIEVSFAKLSGMFCISNAYILPEFFFLLYSVVPVHVDTF